MEERIPVRVLTGPTASGKSEIGLRLALERGWDIICMDSMQIYRRMDIGTAKPSPEERKRVPHHMIDICEPTGAYTVSEYREEAEGLILSLAEKGRGVLFVGGTGLYLQAMMHPMGMGSVPADEALRGELRELSRQEGGEEKLHLMLSRLDPETAARLHPHDIRRVIRAIEVSRATGIPFSKQPDREQPSPFEWRVASTRMPREELYSRINRRVDAMLEAGLAAEVEALLKEGVPEDAQSMAGLGYKEMIPYLRGECSLEEAADRIRLGTRHYAKRQMTFLRRESAVRYADALSPEAYETILDIFEGKEKAGS